MTVQTYRKKPMEIQAMQWTGTNADDLYRWAVRPSDGPVKNALVQCFYPLDDDEIFDVLTQNTLDHFVTVKGASAALWVDANSRWLPVQTSEWVAKDRHGFYPIKDDVFVESYDLAAPVGGWSHGRP